MKIKTTYLYLLGLALTMVFVVLVAILQGLISTSALTNPFNWQGKLQQCPDELVDDQMPGSHHLIFKSQYYILDNNRRELNEFDVPWVEKNCKLKIEVVQ